MFPFTNRIRAKRGNDNIIAKNLDACLLDEANQCYTEEISNINPNGLRYGTVEDWCSTLEKSFSESPGKCHRLVPL